MAEALALPDQVTSDPDRQLGRLCTAVYQSILQLRWVRQKRLDMVRQEAGAHYFEDAALKPVPINILGMASKILGNKLIPKNPRVMLSTFERRHQPAVSILEEWANKRIPQMRLADTLRRCVKDALYFIGIAKVGLANPADADLAAWDVGAGQPFVERIDLDDFVYDIHARDFSECGYMGHRFRLPLSVVHGSRYFGPNRKEVSATSHTMFNLVGDERIGMIARGYYSNQEEYEPFVDLWEIWLRRQGVVITITEDALTGLGYGAQDEAYGYSVRQALRVQKWIGPKQGPYHILGFNGGIPGNPMFKGPLHDIYDLHIGINEIIRKILRKAKNWKQVTVASEGGTEDGKRMSETADGAGCSVKDAKSVTQVVMNQVPQDLMLLLDNLIQRASWLIGNLDLMGGLGPQAKTATQDKINADASATNVGSLQEDTLNWIEGVMRSWLWWEHHHPENVHEVRYRHPTLPRLHLVRRSFPDNEKVHQNDPSADIRREHDFDDMEIRVDEYSLMHHSPQERAQTMIDAVRNIYLPLAQLAMQQGKVLDLDAFFAKLGKYTDDPDLAEIFSTAEKPPVEAAGGQGQASGVGELEGVGGTKDPTEIIRRSQGANSQQAQQATVMNAVKSQAGQAPTIGGQAA